MMQQRTAGKLVLVLFLLMGTLAGGSCARDGRDTSEILVGAVGRYNANLQRAYLEANEKLLYEVATAEQIKKILPAIQALRARRSSMISEQEAFQLVSARMEGNEGRVATSERWVYWWQDAATGQVTKPREEVSYQIEYILSKEGKLWKVREIRPIRN